MARTDFFLKIDGIKGESADSKHKGEIDIESFSWGVTNSGSFAVGGGGGSGRSTFQDVHFTTHLSTASPALALACAMGKHIPKATLVCRKAGEGQQDYQKIEMEDVLISSYQSGGHGGGDGVFPVDQFSLNFSKIHQEYLEQDAKGKTNKTGEMTYSVKETKKF